jgi:hypothetical protein
MMNTARTEYIGIKTFMLSLFSSRNGLSRRFVGGKETFRLPIGHRKPFNTVLRISFEAGGSFVFS